jgi:hypothetical protein
MKMDSITTNGSLLGSQKLKNKERKVWELNLKIRSERRIRIRVG